MPSNKLLSPSKFFGEERYQKYLDEITSQGTIEGEQLTPEERKEGFKKRGDKISFETFVEKILARKGGAGTSEGPTALPSGGGAIVKRVNVPIQDLSRSPVSEKTQENLDDIMKGIDSILETLRADQKVKEDTQKFEKKQKEKAKREKKEEKLESKAFKGLGKTIDKIIKPVKSLFEKLFNFLGTVLLGRVLVKLVNWYTDEKNKGKVDAIGRFLKDTWPALAVGVLAFGTGIGRLITRLTFMVGKWTFKLAKFVIPKLLRVIAANPLVAAGLVGGVLAGAGFAMSQKEKKRQEEQQSERTGQTSEEVKEERKQAESSFLGLFGEAMSMRGLSFYADGGQVPGSGNRDTVPAMLTPGEFVMSKGAVNTFGADTLATMNAAGGGTNKPKYFKGSMFANGGGYVGETKQEKSIPQNTKLLKERTEESKPNKRAWWDFLGWAGTGKKKEETASTGGGSIKGLTAQDFRDLAFIVSGEAQRGTADEYGVAAAVLNRVADPAWPNTIKAVGSQAGQFEAVYSGKAYDDPELAAKLASAEGQAKIVEALKMLKGRTDFKGVSQYANMGSGDIKFSNRGNFYHYKEQKGKTDPPPSPLPNYYTKFIGSGGPAVALETTTPTTSSVASVSRGQTAGGSAPSAPPTPKTSLANLQKAIDFKPAKSAPSIGLPVQRMNANIDALRAAIDGASAPQTSSTSKALNNEIPNISAAIMQSPSKVKTLGVVG